MVFGKQFHRARHGVSIPPAGLTLPSSFALVMEVPAGGGRGVPVAHITGGVPVRRTPEVVLGSRKYSASSSTEPAVVSVFRWLV